MNRERYLVKSFGDNLDGTKAGLTKLIKVMDHHKNVVIVVPKIGDVKHTMLMDVLGEKHSKELVKKRTLTFKDDRRLTLCGHATLKNHKYADAYLALWGSEQTIDDIEALPNWKSVVLVTWIPKDSEIWERNHAVEIIFDDKQG